MPIDERPYMRREPPPEQDAPLTESATSLVPLWRRYWKIYLFVALVLVPGALGGAALVVTVMLCVVFLLLVALGVLRFVRWLIESGQ